MRHLIWFFALVLITASYGKWQPPEGSVKYSTSTSTLEASKLIRAGENKIKFTLSDFDRIEEQLEADRNEIAMGILLIDADITGLVANRQSLIKLRDLEEMKTELQAKRKNYAEMKKTLKNNLADVSHYGLWLVVIDNVSQFLSKEYLRSEAEGALTPQAIATINGTFIESFTQIANNQTIQDYIRTEVSGALRVENIQQQIHRRDLNKFIYLAQISVSSLKSDAVSLDNAGGSSISPSNQYPIHIIDMTDPIDLAVQCGSCGLSREDQELLFRNIDNTRNLIAEQNKNSHDQLSRIVNESSSRLKELAQEIELLESSIEDRGGQIRKTCLQFTNKTCTDSPDDCIRMAVEIIDEKIDGLQQDKLRLKSTEIITQRTQARPETTDPAEDVARAVDGVKGQIDKSFGKLEQFLEVTEVNNSMLTSYKALQKKDVFRQADSVCVFYSGQHDETFIVLIAVTFRVSSGALTANIPEAESEEGTYQGFGKDELVSRMKVFHDPIDFGVTPETLPAKGATIGEELWQDYQKYHASNPASISSPSSTPVLIGTTSPTYPTFPSAVGFKDLILPATTKQYPFKNLALPGVATKQYPLTGITLLSDAVVVVSIYQLCSHYQLWSRYLQHPLPAKLRGHSDMEKYYWTRCQEDMLYLFTSGATSMLFRLIYAHKRSQA